MDEFINDLDPQTFRFTNSPWNELMLNDPWSVGYVTMLIELKTFSNKEEWETFYYEMGDYRNNQIASLSQENNIILNDESLIKKEKQRVTGLSWDLKNINTQNGRTKVQLDKKGLILYNYVKNNSLITLEECQKAVRYRVICETWNGIILREHNTIKNFKGLLNNVSFVKKEGDFDFKYAVDYEILLNGRLLCGIQIKPKSYTFNTPYLRRAKFANKNKNEAYLKEYKVPVFDVISKTNGDILNKNILLEIKKLIID